MKKHAGCRERGRVSRKEMLPTTSFVKSRNVKTKKILLEIGIFFLEIKY